MSRSPSTATPTASPHRGAAGPVPIGRASPFREAVGPADDVFEREADRVADAVLSGGMQYARNAGGWSAAQRREQPVIRRAPAGQADAAPSRSAEVTAPTPAPTALPTTKPSPAPAAMTQEKDEADTPTAAAGGARIVADGVTPGPGQMKKSAFMTALRTNICANVDAALAGTGRDSQGCPWIDHWLGYYQERSAAELERALRRYAPEAASASEAGDYIRFVAARVRKSAQRWAKTGELTDLPQDMPDATSGGGLLAGFGGMFFKARAGGARPADAVSVQRQLGAGESLPGGLRMRMEGAFGTSFGGVRLHTDTTAARLSNALNARAFAIGPHVAFAGGEFQPGTLVGDALIAHELAHVVQQGQVTPAAQDQHPDTSGTGASSEALEHDADRSTAGAATTLWGAGSFSELRRQARPRMRSGLSLQRCASNQKAVAGPQVKVKMTPAQEREEAISGASERLREVNKWVSFQQKAQHVPDIKGVSKLDKDQAGNVATAIDLLTKVSGLSGAKALDALRPKLKEVLDQTKAARPGKDADPKMDAMLGTLALNKAITASNEVDELVAKISQSVDLTGIKKDTDAIATALAGAQSNRGTLEDALDVIGKRVTSINAQIRDIQSRDTDTPKAMERILFVLRSFLALNAPDRVKPPTDAEIKAFTSGPHGNLDHDFSVVFGEGKVVHGFDAFLLYADLIEKQLAFRAKMAAAKVDASPIPTQGNAEDYFKSLKSKKNGEVFSAYEAYAGAFFFHGQVATLDDMNVTDVSELYHSALSIFGVRRLVCTGYAMLGAHLLRKAGATLKEFVVAVRATDEDITSDKIDEGHALAHISRDGKDGWVSNDSIVSSEEGGIGPNAVAWVKSKAPLHKATGSTIIGANERLRSMLGELARNLPKRPANGTPKSK